MKPWRSTLTGKFLLLLLGLLGLQLLQLGVSLYSMGRIGQQGALANALHEQSLQTLQLGELARSAAEKVPGPSSARNTLALQIINYGQGLARIEHMLGRYHEDDMVLIGVAGEANLSWHEYIKPLLQQAGRAASLTAAQRTMERYQELSAMQVERLNRMIRVLEQRDREVARALAWMQTVIVGLSLCVVAIGALMMRHVVMRPLRSFFDVTRAMAAGAYDRRVEIRSKDELGELARAFNQMAQAIEDKTARLHALNEVSLAVASSLSLQEILEQIMRYGIPLVGARGVCIAFYDEASKSFSNWVTRGLSDQYVSTLSFPPNGVAHEVMRRRDYVVAHDRFGAAFPLSAEARAEGIRSIMCLPLASDQQQLGVIYFYRGEGNDFNFEDIELIRTFSHLAAHAIQNAREHELTVGMAETDPLTGLYNRRKLEQRLREEIQRAQRSRRPLALLLLDLDHFKEVNDTYGHAAGDAVLRELAAILRREIRDVDLATRVGGEEFMLLLPETDSERGQRVAERIRRALAGHTMTLPDGARVQVTASLGVACYPANANNAEALMIGADRAMYAAKQAGRNRIQLYSESLLH